MDDLQAAREYFAAQKLADHIAKVLELSGVSEVVMTNDPLDPEEGPQWEAGVARDARFHAVLRLDRILNKWSEHWNAFSNRRATRLTANATGRSATEVRRFLIDWVKRMQPVYMAVSLPDTFAFPEDSVRGRLLEDAVLPACHEVGIPLSLMIGVRYQVNPALRLAGDGVGQGRSARRSNGCAWGIRRIDSWRAF